MLVVRYEAQRSSAKTALRYASCVTTNLMWHCQGSYGHHPCFEKLSVFWPSFNNLNNRLLVTLEMALSFPM